MRILFTGGGSGGHFFPIIAVIRELKKIAEDEKILDPKLYYMGPDDFNEKLLREENVACIRIESGKMRNYSSLANFFDIFKTAFAIMRALVNVFLIMPDVIFSKGGYGALPAVIGAMLFRIPLIIHESDAVPGKINTFSAGFARRIAVAFPGAAEFFPKERTALLGIPIRKRVLGGNLAEAKEDLDIYSNLPVIGIMGASQGAQKINNAVMGIIKELTEEFEVVHQTGTKNLADVSGESSVILEFAHKERYHPYGFFDESKMREFYITSDIIVSRAGASSIFEIAAWANPAILVPLRNSAQDHQRKNAYEYARSGGAIVIEEENLRPHVLRAEIKKVLNSPELMKKMKESAQRFSRIDSAEIIAREILEIGTTH